MTDLGTNLRRRLDATLGATAGSAPAAVLAALAGGEAAVACHGDPAPDAHTVFELGSITKTFTALLLAEMVACGEVSYHDPITAYLPPEAVPRHSTGTSIILAHLVTHTAGLPRSPANLYRGSEPSRTWERSSWTATQ